MGFVRIPTLITTLALGAACLVLAFLLINLTQGGLSAVRTAGTAAPALSPPANPPFLTPAAYSSMARDNPLFHPDRRSVENAALATGAETAGPNADSEPPFQLKGIVLTNGTARASLLNNSDGEIIWVDRGSVIDGWQLVQVRSNSVVLSRGEHRKSLRLHQQRTN